MIRASQELIQRHLSEGTPIRRGVAHAIWLMNHLLGDKPESVDVPEANITYHSTPEAPPPPDFPHGLRLRTPPELGWQKDDDLETTAGGW